jgi:hypothetical protein
VLYGLSILSLFQRLLNCSDDVVSLFIYLFVCLFVCLIFFDFVFFPVVVGFCCVVLFSFVIVFYAYLLNNEEEIKIIEIPCCHGGSF